MKKLVAWCNYEDSEFLVSELVVESVEQNKIVLEYTYLQSQLMNLSCHFANDFVMTEDTISSHVGIIFNTFSAHFQPIRRGKINGLSQIETCKSKK